MVLLRMNVTKENFLEILPQLTEHIKNATYMSVDFEMTGLYLPTDKQLQTDTVEERYYKMRAGIEAGLRTLQFGITLSHYNPETQSVTHTPYNIYTWPTQTNLLDSSAPIEQPNVLLDVDSIEFNRQHNMNFSEWINSGISMVHRDQCGIIDESKNRVVKREESYMVSEEISDHKAALGKAISTKTFNEYERSLIQRYTSTTMEWLASQLFEKHLFNQAEYDEFLQQAANVPVRHGGRGRGGYNRGRWKKNNSNKKNSTPQDNITDETKQKQDDIKAVDDENNDEMNTTISEDKINDEEEPIKEPITSWVESKSFEVADDTYDNRNLLLMEVELSLWKLCRKHKLIARTAAYRNPETNKRGMTLTLYTHDQYQIYLDGITKDAEDKRIMMYGATYIWHLMTNSLIARKTLKNIDNTKITGSSSPLIVHNGFFDLMFLYHHCEGSLPKTFAGMSKELMKFFPNGIYDTKFIFVHPQTQNLCGFEHTKGISNSLGGLYLWFTKQQIKQQNDLLKLLAPKQIQEVQPLEIIPEQDSTSVPVVEVVENENDQQKKTDGDVEEVTKPAEASTQEEAVVSTDEITNPIPVTSEQIHETQEEKTEQEVETKVEDKKDEKVEEKKEEPPSTPSKKYRQRKEKTEQVPFPALFITHELRSGFDTYSTDQNRCHEAGYDSWITSVLFGHLMLFCASDPIFQAQLKLDGTVDITPTPSTPSEDEQSIIVATEEEQEEAPLSVKIPIPTNLSTTNLINRVLELPFFRSLYRYRTNSFGQYSAFNFGYLADENVVQTNYFLATNDQSTPVEKRADSFMFTIKMQQFADRLIKQGHLEPFPAHWNKYVAIPGVYPSDLAQALSKYFIKHLESIGLVDPNQDGPVSGQPFVDVVKQIHLPLDRNNKDAVFYCKIAHNRLLLSTLDTSLPGNLFTPHQFAQHLYQAFRTAPLPAPYKGGDNSKDEKLVNLLNYITPQDIIIEPYPTFLAKRDLEHLYSINEAPEDQNLYPLCVLTKGEQNEAKAIAAQKNAPTPSSSFGGVLHFILGAALGAVAAVACGAAVLYQPKNRQ